jgi:hypothetical protein
MAFMPTFYRLSSSAMLFPSPQKGGMLLNQRISLARKGALQRDERYLSLAR